MKRLKTKKIKADSACAESNQTLVMQLMLQLQVKKRLRSSVAMMSLVILMGTPNFLLTQESDRTPASESVGKPISSIVPATIEIVEPPAAVPLFATNVYSASRVLSTPQPQQDATTTAPAAIESNLYPEQPFEQLSDKFQKNAVISSKFTADHIFTATVTEFSPEVNPVSSISEVKEVRTARENQLIQKLKASKIAEIPLQSSEVNNRNIAPVVTTVRTVQPLEVKQVEIPFAADSALKVKQKFLINRLKESLAAPSLESNHVSVPTVNLTKPNYAAAKNLNVTTVEDVQQLTQRSPQSITINNLKSGLNWQKSRDTQKVIATPNEAANLALQLSPQLSTPAQPVELSSPDVTVDQNVESNWNPQEPSTAFVIPEVKTPKPKNSSLMLQAKDAQVELSSPDVTVEQKAAESNWNPQEPSTAFVIPAVTTSEPKNSPLVLQTEDEAKSSLKSNFDIESTPQQPSVAPKPVFIVPKSNIKTEPTEVAKSVLTDYQVKRGDTLTAIAQTYNIPLSKLIKANRFNNPNLIQIAQEVKIPTFEDSIKVRQTDAISTSPTYAQINASSGAVLGAKNSPKSPAEQPLNTVYTGMGGSISDEAEALATPPAAKVEETATEPELVANLDVHSLQADIDKLRHKYANESISEAVPTLPQVTAPNTTSNSSQAINQSRPSLPVQEPVNPEFRSAQIAQTWQPDGQEQPDDVSSTAPKSRVAKAPINVNASESLQSFGGRQVSPELPPLGTGDTYLPTPGSIPYKNFIWPTKGALTSGYGWRWGRMHRGIDIAAPIGTPVMAAAPGVVERAGWNSGGYGRLIDIRHGDGTLTRYAHNNRILVQAGQVVDQGQRISEMGNSGFSTGPHLHFEVHPVGKKGAVNPIALLPRR